MVSKYFLSLVVYFLTAQAFAFPMPSPYMDLNLLADIDSQYDFTAIVGLSNCSGSLVRFEKSQGSNAAMVLTNGHCLEAGFPKPNSYVLHRPTRRAFTLFNSQATVVGQLSAAEVIYATMTGTDITLYKLTQSYDQIEKAYHVRPLTLASTHPRVGQAIDILSGYWIKGYHCAIDAFVHQLSEGGWIQQDSIRYTQPGCDIIGGTSGSPVIASGTHEVIGVNNTSNEDGGECSEDNPCEIDANGQVQVQKGASYGQQTFWIYSCLDANMELKLDQPGCQLYH